MLTLLRRKVSTVLRYLFPTAGDRAYLAALKDSGLFDRAYYLDSNPRLNPLFRIWPERHYIQLGERNGVCPGAAFSPRAYLFHNPDLSGLSRPLLHYIETGRAEGRVVLAGRVPGGVPRMPRLPEVVPRARLAVALHLYYPELWEGFAKLLAAQSFDFDLFVTLTERPDLEATGPAGPTGTAGLAARIGEAFPGAHVWTLPNHGRDILPFLHLVNEGVLTPYRAVCKLHGKKSPHRADGDQWRQQLVAGVLGDPARTRARLERFLADPSAGIWVADGHLHEGDEWWGANRAPAEALLAARGLALAADGPLRFPAGSIYWARAEVIAALRRLDLGPADFDPEQALVDGTTAHAVERLMGHVAALAGTGLREGRMLD